ncbi:MAG: CPBP family intramembrane metalloprotease [Sulfurovum sp.]|nr:CPBP family intramembrane metalloprotease [Sulfurovum sp.]
MLNLLRRNPLLSALLIVLMYGLWFVVPMFFMEVDPKAHGAEGIDGVMKEGVPELITASVLVVLVTLLGWWKKIGFCAIKPGSIKFIIPIVLLIMLMLGASFYSDTSDTWFLGFHSPTQLSLMIGTMLLLGFVEEGVFRGVLLYGLNSKFAALYAVFVSSLIFGLFHFVNLATGADLVSTTYQVIHAFSMGFLYAALRLALGAIWPLIILHGLWDFSVFVMQTAMPSHDVVQGNFSVVSGAMMAIPALTYGIFVYWRWSKR